jgi:phosphopantetheinyl transferase (holo-ACP synthase)
MRTAVVEWTLDGEEPARILASPGEVFSSAELWEAGPGSARAARLAARAAAKQALRNLCPELTFRDVELRTEPGGRPRLLPAGPALPIRIHVSLTHTRRRVAAVVVLEEHADP